MESTVVLRSEIDAAGGSLAAEDYVGGSYACARCGFAPRSGRLSSLVEKLPSGKAYRCVNRKGCDARKARGNG